MLSLLHRSSRQQVVCGLMLLLLCGFAAAGRAEIPSAYLNPLSDPPAFMARIEDVSEQLNAEITGRKRILKEAQNQNSKIMQGAVMAPDRFGRG